MSFWTAVVIIVAIGAITSVLRARYRAQHGIISDSAGNEKVIEREDANAQRELEELRERIQVLERIATDGNTPDARETQRIAEEIEALRDKQGE